MKIGRPSILRLYPALEIPAFRVLWMGMLPATLALQMGIIARPYVAFSLTGSASTLGLVSLASGLPMLLLSLVGGVAADRFPRRSVLLWTHLIFVLTASATAALVWTGRLEVWHLLVVAMAQGAAMPFNMPARQAFIAEVVGRNLLPNAVALNNAGMNLGRLAAQALAGLLLAAPGNGAGLAFGVMALLFAFVLGTLFRLDPMPRGSGQSRPRRGGLAELTEGLRFARRSPSMLALLAMGGAMGIFGMQYQTLMTVFAERVFHVGGGGLGLMMAITGAGALIGSLATAAARFERPGWAQVASGIVFGVSLIGFSFVPWFPVALVLLAVAGFCSAMFMSLNSTLMVTSAPSELYGRVMSIYQLTFAAQPLGAVPLAWLADYAGVPIAMALAGTVVVAIVAGVGFLHPTYRAIADARVVSEPAPRSPR